MVSSRSKNYTNLRFYLQRVHKLKESGCISNFLIEKYSNAKNPTEYVAIYASELKDAGIISLKSQFQRMYEFREVMCKKNILICKAGENDMQDKDANYKAAEFKFGKSIAKYIEASIIEKKSLLERIDKKVDFEEYSIDKMENKLEQEKMKDKIADLELKVEDLDGLMNSLLLTAYPPDNAEGRKIIKDSRLNKEECILRLKEHTKNNLVIVN